MSKIKTSKHPEFIPFLLHILLLSLTSIHSALSHSPLVVTVKYEEEQYSVEEEAGYVTLGLVLKGDAPFPVTVSVNTLYLQNSSVGNAATGKVLKFA